MSLSLARPIFTDPGGSSPADFPGRKIFIIDVAMLPASPPSRPPEGVGDDSTGGR